MAFHNKQYKHASHFMIPSVCSLDYRFCAWGAVPHASSDRWPGPDQDPRTHNFRVASYQPFKQPFISSLRFTLDVKERFGQNKKDVSRESCAACLSHIFFRQFEQHTVLCLEHDIKHACLLELFCMSLTLHVLHSTRAMHHQIAIR